MSTVATHPSFLNDEYALPTGVESTSEMEALDDGVRNAAAALMALPGVRGTQFGRSHSWSFANGFTGGMRHSAWCVRARMDDGDDIQVCDEDLGDALVKVEKRITDKVRPRPTGAKSAADAYAEALEEAAATDTENSAA